MPSFDIVSKVQHNEVDNAFNQAQKEIAQRFDFKDTETTLEKAPDAITIRSGSEDRAKAALTVLQDKLVKRKVSLRFTDPGKPETTGKGGARIVVKIKEGIEVEKARAHRADHQGVEAQGAGLDPGAPGARHRQEQGRPAGRHPAPSAQHDLGIELQFINFRD